MCETAINVFSRGINYQSPSVYSNTLEVSRLTKLHRDHFSDASPITKSAALGIYAHSSDTPHGLRLAIEYAMQVGNIKFVICTSTLAQGVNLPIKYLIVTGIYQAGERIRVRDFHNLIGRAGRSGMHTEGSIIFADPIVYDNKNDADERWRWIQVKETLDPKNTEPCRSTIISIFNPIVSDNKFAKKIFNAVEFVAGYVENHQKLSEYLENIALSLIDRFFTVDGVYKQLNRKLDIIAAIESYLLAHWDSFEQGQENEAIENLAIGTLAYYTSNVELREQLVNIFKLLANNIKENVTDSESKVAFGKTLYGLGRSIELKNWVNENVIFLLGCSTDEEIIDCMWPILELNIENKTFNKIDNKPALKQLLMGWLSGKPYHELHSDIVSSGAKYIAGKQRRNITQEHIIEICDSGISYDGTLLISALTEIYALILRQTLGNEPEGIDIVVESTKFSALQKRMKYGLESDIAVVVYEAGFSDRVISTMLASYITVRPPYKNLIINELCENESAVVFLLDEYPSYYHKVFQEILERHES